jgi:hypothetical protein
MRGKLDRRTFLKLGTAASLSLSLGRKNLPAKAQTDTSSTADLIVMNGHIATQDDRRSFVSAVAIKEGRFLAVGTDKEMMAYKGDTTQVINVGGRTVIPGLNDSHLHLIRGGLNYNLELRWDGVPSLADALRRLRAQVQRTPPNQWVRVVGGSSEEGKKGAIIPGQLADLAVLSADYFSVSEKDIQRIESVLTIVGGKVVYGAGEYTRVAPPSLPVTPEWSPVAKFGQYGQPAPVALQSEMCRKTTAASRPIHAVNTEARHSLPDKQRFWGTSCDCFAF